VTGHSSYYPWAPGHYKTVFARLGELSEATRSGSTKRRQAPLHLRTKKEVVPSDITVLNQPSDSASRRS